MSLLRQLKEKVLVPLSPKGWGKLFSLHGLNIDVPLKELEAELSKTLRIDRRLKGFEDLALGAVRAVEPARPGYSLLYHAFASTNVTPGTEEPDAFPSLEQLDIIENYIFSCAKRTLTSFKDPVVAVFAYQYRGKQKSTHRRHADMVYSRTGIARVGNQRAQYDRISRGFISSVGAGRRGFRALPARYAAFLCERRTQAPNGSVMRGVPLDQELMFVFPVLKLFSGDECLYAEKDGMLKPINIEPIRFFERHVNEKLRRVHTNEGDNPGYVAPIEKPRFRLDKYPYVIDSNETKGMVRLVKIGESCLVEPLAAPLVRTDNQVVNGRPELVRFKVPAPKVINGRQNRYWSTFEITAIDQSRAAPEYLSIRQEVIQRDGKWSLVDLNLANNEEFDKKVLKEGGYEAAHFIDNTCDGALSIKPLRNISLPSLCAFSLVSAIDYFPNVDQIEVEEWIEKRQHRAIGMADSSLIFPQGGPQPMSDGRFELNAERPEVDLITTYQLPNCSLPHPTIPSASAFGLADSTNFTVTAVVGSAATSDSLGDVVSQRRALGWLPDSASDVFAPGWDVSQHRYKNQNMLVAYGLGSPFPEDAKLCAALNSFWPAVSPDSGRTYGYRPPRPDRPPRLLHTSIPLLDSELGYHAHHPRVQFREVRSNKGWDGDYGPFIIKDGEQRYVDASNPLRADQTRAAFEGKLGFNGLDHVTTESFLIRIEALAWCRMEFDGWCRQEFNKEFDHILSKWWLVHLEQVSDWKDWRSRTFPKADAKLRGDGFIFTFATVEQGIPYSDPALRIRYRIVDSFEIQIGNLKSFLPANLNFNSADIFRKDHPVVFYRRNHGSFIEKPL